MRLAYADPPYLGCCGLYGHDHRAPYGCWDDPFAHWQLLVNLKAYDGFVVHLSVPSLATYLGYAEARDVLLGDYRVMAWTKPFAAFKRNVPVAYAWEPVIVKAARKPEVTGRMVMRDFISEGITMKRGLTGAKPERVCHWVFECMGAQPDDELVDLFPGSGAASRAWDSWRQQLDFGPVEVLS